MLSQVESFIVGEIVVSQRNPRVSKIEITEDYNLNKDNNWNKDNNRKKAII